MSRTEFESFLLSVLFETNTFASSAELLDAINAANAIDENTNWRERKEAFNAIAEKASLSDSYGFCITLADVPGVLASMGSAYQAAQESHAHAEADQDHAACQNCGTSFEVSELDPIDDIFQRVAPGEPMPAGQCPLCGSLCQLTGAAA